LLVSVRSVAEAEAALVGGADVIDVKEPSRGSLGKADDDTIAAIVRTVIGRRKGRRPVSAAMGDLAVSDPTETLPSGLTYLKWGLAGWSAKPNRSWIGQLSYFREHIRLQRMCKLVVVAYGDWQRANAPSPQEVWDGIVQRQCGAVRTFGCDGLLIDTYEKDGSTLLDWMPIARIALLCRLCQNAELPIALAGSLGSEQITALRHLRPNWFAVRGAACRDGKREGMIDAEQVRLLKTLISMAGG
jgi:uncharacterized protein (UPF0264 family)